jgi:hypothetical protein
MICRSVSVLGAELFRGGQQCVERLRAPTPLPRAPD